MSIRASIEDLGHAVKGLLTGKKPAGTKIRYAVVAAGWISQAAFMPGVGQTNNSVMTALVSDDAEKCKKLGAQYNLKTYKYDQFQQMLLDDVCDAIYLATPNWLHRKFAVPALELGFHVLLEKPMEMTIEDCEAINEAQKKTGAKLMIAYRLHHEEGTLTTWDLIRGGGVGDARVFQSGFTQNLKGDNHRAKHGFDAGPVPDLGVYCINAARNVFLSEPTHVTAVGFKDPARTDLKIEHDTVSVTLRFPGDRVAQFTVSYSTKGEAYFKVYGTQGDITVSPSFMFGPGVHISYRGTINGKEVSHKFPETDQFAGETEYFSDCILNNTYPEADGEEGLLDVRVVLAIQKALQTGQTIELPPAAKSTKRSNLSQVKRCKQAKIPSNEELVGRDSQPPS